MYIYIYTIFRDLPNGIFKKLLASLGFPHVFSNQKTHINHQATFRGLGQHRQLPTERDLQAEWTKWQKQLREWRQSYDVPWTKTTRQRWLFLLITMMFPKGKKHNYKKNKTFHGNNLTENSPPQRKKSHGWFLTKVQNFFEKISPRRWWILYQAAVN